MNGRTTAGIIVIGMALLVVIVSIRLAVAQAVAPAPFAYSQAIYLPDGVTCDIVRYTVASIIQRTPVLVESARTIWSVDQQRTVVFAENPRRVIWLEPTTITGTVTMTITTLPPGRYEVRGMGYGHRPITLPDAYRVPFEKSGACP